MPYATDADAAAAAATAAASCQQPPFHSLSRHPSGTLPTIRACLHTRTHACARMNGTNTQTRARARACMTHAHAHVCVRARPHTQTDALDHPPSFPSTYIFPNQPCLQCTSHHDHYLLQPPP